MTNVNQYSSWHVLEDHAKKILPQKTADLFAKDPERFSHFSFELPGLLVDFSKNKITADTIKYLVQLAHETGLEAKIKSFLSGDRINTTENRAVMHTALRAKKDRKILINGIDVVPSVQDILNNMSRFATAVRDGSWTGHNGKQITDIVNIGIGGSSLGPQLVTEALAHFHHPRLRCHFVANVEASDLETTLAHISPETTLFIVASKTFTTAETMQNADIARDWLLKAFNNEQDAIRKHFVAASTNASAVKAFGIAEENMFPFSDWVGGRYSVWSAIGLSVMLMTGPDAFRAFLDGAEIVDAHFATAPLHQNIPVLMGLIGIWHRNFMYYPAYAAIPYHAALKRLPAFLQQLDMESNGKAVDKNGESVAIKTGPMIFGEPGTDAQHSFFQWLHQSPDIVPIDFIAAIETPHGTLKQQRMLLSNILAQSEALMTGKASPDEPHRNFTGDRPSTMILLDALMPRTLGMLLALYEHKVFVQGAIWNINSFDQWGVELGKALAKAIEQDLDGATTHLHDGSTAALITRIKDRL